MAQLELSTTREPENVLIDGVAYELFAWDDLEVEEQLEGRKAMKKLSGDEWEKITDTQTKWVKGVVHKMLRRLLPSLPEEILDKLNFAKRGAIVLASYKGSGDFMPKDEEDETKS